MKFKLVIPDKYLWFVTPDLSLANQAIRHGDDWEEALFKTGWLYEVKEPMSLDEAWEEYGGEEHTRRSLFNIAWWKSRENLELEEK